MKLSLRINKIEYILFVSILLFIFSSQCFSQTESSPVEYDKDFRIELEPAGFIYGGYGAFVTYNITKNNRINVGLYSTSLTLPDWTKPGMFENVSNDADVRLGFELALVARYKFDIGNGETDPYIGLITGWEYFDINQSSLPEIRISTILATPYIGYEIYFFKQMLYLNPQLRSVLYLSKKKSIETRPENLEPIFILPTVSLGIRL